MSRRRREGGGSRRSLGRLQWLIILFLGLVMAAPLSVLIIGYANIRQDLGRLGRDLKGVEGLTSRALENAETDVEDTVEAAREASARVVKLQLRERTVELSDWVAGALRRMPPHKWTAEGVAGDSSLESVRDRNLPAKGLATLIDPATGTIVLHKLHAAGTPIEDVAPELAKVLAEEGSRLDPFLRDAPAPPAPKPPPAPEPTPEDGAEAPAPTPKPAPKPVEPKVEPLGFAPTGLSGRQLVITHEYELEGEDWTWHVTPIEGTPFALAVQASLTSASTAFLDEIPTVFSESQADVRRTLTAVDGMLERFQSDRHDLETLIDQGVLVGIFATVILLFVALVMVRVRILAPIDEMTTVAKHIRAGDYDRRVSVMVGGELGQLARSVNEMLDRIVGLIESEEDKERLQANIVALLELVSRASEGDMTVRGRVTDDVLGSVVDGLNLMLESIGHLAVQVREAALQVAEAAQAIGAAQVRVDEGAASQLERLDAAGRHVQVLASSLQAVAHAAGSAREAAGRANDAAQVGGEAVQQTVEGMYAIRRDVALAAKHIKGLGEKSLEINAITELIDDIAAQTNMLALNSAIEASRAGAQGKGFAVVAEEVRKLAERSSEAAREISTHIESIQTGVGSAVQSMEEVQHKVEDGVRVADNAGQQLSAIAGVVADANRLIEEIHAAAEDQAVGAGRLAEAIEEIQETSSLTAEQVRLSTGAVNELRSQSEILIEAIRRFKVEEPVEVQVTRTLMARRDDIEASLAQLETLMSEGARDPDVNVEEAAAAIRDRVSHLFDQAMRRVQGRPELVPITPPIDFTPAPDDESEGSDDAPTTDEPHEALEDMSHEVDLVESDAPAEDEVPGEDPGEETWSSTTS